MALGSNSGSYRERQVVHSDMNFFYCLLGRIEYVIDGTVHLLETGDILIFEATLPT
jgi:uncharacterized cupin superfamily protein